MTSKTRIGSLIAGVVLLAAGARPTFAHHSFAAEFDSNKPFTVSGVVSKVAWQNPHVYVYVDAMDESGKMARTFRVPAASNQEEWQLRLSAAGLSAQAYTLKIRGTSTAASTGLTDVAEYHFRLEFR